MKITTLMMLMLCIISFLSTSAQEQTEKKKKNGEFAVVPYINYSNNAGVGFGLIPMFSFRVNRNDSVSPKSNIGVGAIYLSNGSYSVGTYGGLYFGQDKWRIVYALGKASRNFQTFIQIPFLNGFFLDYNTFGNFFVVDVKRRVYKELFLGGGYSYAEFNTTFPDIGVDSTIALSTLNLDAFRDRRDNVYYPTAGSQFSLKINLVPTFLGNESSSTTIILNYNQYRLRSNLRDVLATRVHMKTGLKKLAFQQQPVLGGTDLRGYTNGKYRGDGVMDVQSEYRWNFPNRFHLGAVFFGGIGTIYGAQDKCNDWKILPSIGGGIRYTALRQDHLNVGVDVGLGLDDWGVYFRLSEAF